MTADPVTTDVWVGPCPETAGDIAALAEAGITAVLNLQTDDELSLRGVALDRLRRELVARGMALQRVPVRDFDEGDLVARLPEAVTALARLLDQGHTTYVHCTAGMGRAPAVVLAHLARTRGLAVAERVLQQRHPPSAPNVAAVRRARPRLPAWPDGS